ncbi:YegS/Rv2252/BmrU family lipid kinase [Anaerosolibacter carboniphilus]|uniref:YegS/Rv2252/BmrU family lipid kinase n=1 Tax=Anaerosolibacter carboniphilus TaxID=1417629 RepID=A0A841KXA5_9FIRM|nr:diacylglycerol kinase family protein [Anaerosolibacter carboniphilus]MBB6218071.1 YegS/Rv2252/BmrU family lipid kinase [Anaerosolibacter carboniphilus]
MDWMFIINPVAGKGKGRIIAQQIHQFMKDKVIPYDIRFTRYKGDGEILAKEAVIRGCSTIIAVGGDGTIYEVINGMGLKTAALGIVPSGTGNDLAKTLGIPKSPMKALKIIYGGHKVIIDCGQANGRYFLNVASVGLDAEIVKETENIKKYIKGPSAYAVGVLKTLLHFRNKEILLEIDGIQIKRQIMLVAVANGRYYGGGMKIAPQAEIEDGYFDICIINRISKGKLLRLFPTIFSGEHMKIKEVELIRGKIIKISGIERLMLNVDGDIVGEAPVSIEIYRGGIEVFVPQ